MGCSKKEMFLISGAAEAEQQNHDGTTAGRTTHHQTQNFCHEPGEASRDEVDGVWFECSQ
jgi:hypothetical protein